MTNTDFEKDFMLNIQKKDKEFYEFGRENFYLNASDNEIEINELNTKVDSLKKLTVQEKRLAKARLKQFEEDNDLSKTLPSTIAIIAAILVFIRMLILFDSNLVTQVIFLAFAGVGVLIISASVSLYTGRNYRRLGVYLNSLLAENLKYESKETETPKEEMQKA